MITSFNQCALFFFYLLLMGAMKARAKQGDALSWLMKSKYFNGATQSDQLPASKVTSSEQIIIPQMGSKEGDKIIALPGQPGETNFAQYAGYVVVDNKSGRALFYYFTEAPTPSSKPLLLWLNGGPGCSSFGYGAMEELGPFRVKSDSKSLSRNPYAWNSVANVLFVESPAGVGFSYSNTSTDYELSGDRRTADDSYIFLMNWLERFTEYKTRDFYIAGESYAGHYVPQLAQTILHHNKQANKTLVNLKGITVGNAILNDATDMKGMVDYFWTHALISDETFYQAFRYCNFSDLNIGTKCKEALRNAIHQIGPIDIYNIYAPRCHLSIINHHPKITSVDRFDPCSDTYIRTYLNMPEVQKALHANVTQLKHPWNACSNLTWRDSPSTVLPILLELLSNNIRVWVYSGDVDGRVPVTSTKYSLNTLKLKVEQPWHPWLINGEVGGYYIVYKNNLTFITIRGAGHEVPSYQPQRALALISHFLVGIQLGSS